MVAVLAGGVLGALAGPVVAAESDNLPITPAGEKAGSGSGGAGVDKMPWLDGWPRVGLALAAVVVMIFAAGYLLKRGSRGGQFSRGKGVFEVIGRGQVSMKHQVYLVRLGRRLLVLGSGGTGLSALAEITDPQEVLELIELAQGAGSQSFRNLLERKAQAFQTAQAAQAGQIKDAGGAGEKTRDGFRGKPQVQAEDSYDAVRQLKEKLLARLGEENQDKHE
jgi:flagellar biogenesis protein FliO